MNFVDVQPKSFLDYAWTSPSAAATNAIKPSKTSRKQNRCCDQCRKGKRACDAAILEDTLLENNKSGGHPTVFHYSDVYGPLASCGNCEKTKKNCTFEWLRSQRVLQASQPQVSAAPPAKRRRTQRSLSGDTKNSIEYNQDDAKSKATTGRNVQRGSSLSDTETSQLGVTFGDFPCGASMFATDPTMALFQEVSPTSIVDDTERGSDHVAGENWVPLDCDSGKGSSLETLSEHSSDKPENGSPSTAQSTDAVSIVTVPKSEGKSTRNSRKRRRYSSLTSISNGALPCPAISFASDLLTSNNNARLTESLLKIYHDSFENALACWVTERTCPYTARSGGLLATDARPDWNRIYHRVFRLDRLASTIRGRQLTHIEDQAASRALNLAVFSFASQWAQSSPRSRTKYPFHSGSIKGNVFDCSDQDRAPEGIDFDRTLQVTAWHEARGALQNAGEVESFRVVLAQIIFALTQKPVDTPTRTQDCNESHLAGEFLGPQCDAKEDVITDDLSGGTDRDMDECESLMSKLNLAIEADGPPVHLESGLRLIHSLRSRMAIRRGKPKSSLSHRARQRRSIDNHLEDADRATVDLLFWLGVMFDTLSAAMHKRPLVVSDEDSDTVLNESMQTENLNERGVSVASTEESDGRWDDYLFARQREQLNVVPTRWPCTFDQAATSLCDAAPVKVLLFRRVTRVQTLVTRNARGEKVEKSIRAALDVCDHWNALYAPFIRDCIQNHDRLPPRVQSWYVCVTGHWHLATLLLADLMELVDEAELGVEEATNKRTLSGFVSQFRESNCKLLSDLARCACPRENASFPQSREFHFAVSEGALLTEPWTAVLIRAFAKAGVLLLEFEALLPGDLDQEDAFRRADDCIKALWFLGRKSDMALSAAKILGEALKQRRKSALDRVSDMSVFLESELWNGMDGLDGTFEVDCEL